MSIYRMIKLQNILNEVNVVLPSDKKSKQLMAYIKAKNLWVEKNQKPLEKLNLSIFGYNVSGYEFGYELGWEGNGDKLNATTRKNLENIEKQLKKYNFKWEKIYVGIVPNSFYKHKYQKSFYILGSYGNNKKLLVSRKQTQNPASGQTYIYVDGIKRRLIQSSYGIREINIIKPIPSFKKDQEYEITYIDSWSEKLDIMNLRFISSTPQYNKFINDKGEEIYFFISNNDINIGQGIIKKIKIL